MRYFLDTEYNGFGGTLLSLALVPADGSEEFYAVITHDGPLDPWVERNVLPFLDTVPQALRAPHLSRAAAADTILLHKGLHDRWDDCGREVC